ncbi:unnamed protein product, partial [Rotaria magnacalcarata]
MNNAGRYIRVLNELLDGRIYAFPVNNHDGLSIADLSKVFPAITGLTHHDANADVWKCVFDVDADGNLLPANGDTWHYASLYVPVITA